MSCQTSLEQEEEGIQRSGWKVRLAGTMLHLQCGLFKCSRLLLPIMQARQRGVLRVQIHSISLPPPQNGSTFVSRF